MRLTSQNEPERTALYRIFAGGDLLLYIGISKDFGTRWNQHAKAQPWWGEMERQTVDWYPSRPDADEAETTAIKAEKPKYNIVHAEPKPLRPRGAMTPAPRKVNSPGGGARHPISPDRLFPLEPLPGCPTKGELILAEPGKLDRIIRRLPEESRGSARAFLEGWLDYIKTYREVYPLLGKARMLEQRGGEIGEAARRIRQKLTRALLDTCDFCNNEPPAGMACEECGRKGDRAVYPGRRLEVA